MSRDLPARPSLELLRKQAKELLRDVRRQDPDALQRFRSLASRPASAQPKLADAQHVIAREYGFASWAELKARVEQLAVEADPFAELAAAVKADDAARAAELLRRHPELASRLNAPMPGGPFGAPVLAPAVDRRNREMIDLLLRHGADINGKSHWWAGGFGVLELCEPELAPFLIERGAVVDAVAAARLGMLDALDALVAADPELVHARGGDGHTPLHVASTVEVARYLLDRGADIDALDVDHESTPAQYMVRDQQDVARFLVRRGCRTDILMAAALGDLELVRRYLDEDPASIRTRVSARWFPMRDARAGGTIYIWTLGSNRTAYAVAREFGHDAVVRLLMERSPDEVRLAEACATGDDAAIGALLAARPDLARTLPDDERRKLADAAEDGDTAAARRMLAAGWPADARGDHNATALHFAAWFGNVELVRELLRHGAPVEVREDRYGGTPLGWAVHGSRNSWRKDAGDYAATVEALLRAGAVAPGAPDEVNASEAVREVLRRYAGRK